MRVNIKAPFRIASLPAICTISFTSRRVAHAGRNFLQQRQHQLCSNLHSSMDTPVANRNADLAPLLNPLDPPPSNNLTSFMPSMTATATVTVTVAPSQSPTALPMCPGRNNTLYVSPNQDVWWVLCAQEPPPVKRNALVLANRRLTSTGMP